ncbi:hypothetical protein [Anaeromyxobacter terrae]|uniref:hypothetical protein n=1 Tax=Anaeromyxobacter terrae TaxID=2925406 RepID=UPI001F579600|nr:hypothetical protein [Anaeromyxobacter sp. SG22]
MKTARLHRWPLFVIALGAVGLVGARMVWPSLHFDSTSLILFGVAGLALLVAYLPLKRIKWGEFEAELDRYVDALEQKVVASENAAAAEESKRPAQAGVAGRSGTATPFSPATAASRSQESVPRSASDEWFSLVNSKASNVEKILSASILLDKVVQMTATQLGLTTPGSVKGPRALIDRFVSEGLIGRDESAAFMDFWNIRNKVVHHGLQPSDEQTARVLDLVWRLVRTFG